MSQIREKTTKPKTEIVVNHSFWGGLLSKVPTAPAHPKVKTD